MRACLLFLLFAVNISQTTSLSAKLSLAECQTIALENAGKKSIADLKALIAYDRIDEARSSGRPKINAQADYMSSGEAKHWHKNDSNKHARASLVVPLYNFGLTRESVLSQRKLYQSALYSIDQITQEILYAVNQAYFELLIYQKLEWIVQESIRSLDRQLSITNDFLSHGMVHRNEVLVIEVQLAQLQQEILEAQLNTELATIKLNRLMGMELNQSIEIEECIPDSSKEDCLDDLIETTKFNHPELLALKSQMEAAEHTYKAEKAALYPNIYAFSNYSTSSDYALPYKHGLDIGIGVDLTLYDGGNTYAKLRRIKKELWELEWNYHELEKDIELKIRSAYLAIKTAQGKIPVALKGIKLAEENLQLTKNLFEEGLVNNIDVIKDDESLSQARLNYYKALYTFHLSRANLIYSAGMMYKKGCF